MALVLISDEATAQAHRLPKPILARVLRVIARLESWPNVAGVKPLRHKLAGHFRIRTGDYRVQFSVSGDNVLVEKIGHRDRFYEE